MPFDIEDFAYPPVGGKVKLTLYGLILPALIIYHAADTWLSQETYWPGRRSGMVVRGECAQAMAVIYLSIAAFIHFRWFWGLLQKDRIFQVGTVGSLVTALAAFIWALAALA